MESGLAHALQTMARVNGNGNPKMLRFLSIFFTQNGRAIHGMSNLSIRDWMQTYTA
jgi:hypothetical protein